MSVLGKTELDGWSVILGTDFLRFQSPTGMNGLARERQDGKRLEILAVNATEEGKGQFREFIHQCKTSYEIIIVWDVWSDIVRDALSRYGFRYYTETLDGEKLIGYRYDVGRK